MSKPAPTIHEPTPDSDDPFAICGWACLFQALRLINEHDPEHRIESYDADAIEHYVLYQRDLLLAHQFPRWKPTRAR